MLQSLHGSTGVSRLGRGDMRIMWNHEGSVFPSSSRRLKLALYDSEENCLLLKIGTPVFQLPQSENVTPERNAES